MGVISKHKLYSVTNILSSVAQGNTPADTVIQNVNLVNVCTKEIIHNIDVAISMGRIALVGDGKHCIGEKTIIIDGKNEYIAPGFLDGHIHVESSMLSVSEYAKAVIPHGTVGIYMDPHEMCNVLGLDGVKLMMEDGRHTPLKTMLTTPSCVPAIPGFEDSGASINAEDVASTMGWENTVGLGEMMNFPGILSSQEIAHDIIGETLKAGKIITGHYSLLETGAGLNGYIAAGIRCCHESTRAEDALAKMRLGMYAQFREGSAWHDLHEVAKSITENPIDTRFATLVSDDTHPNTLVSKGHMDHILRRALEEGIDVITAIQMVTINTAQCFRMDHELGSITPSKCADIVFLDNLMDLNVTRVIINGELVAENGKILYKEEKFQYPHWATHTMNIKNKIIPSSFLIPIPNEFNNTNHVKVRAIEVIPGKVGTYEKIYTFENKNGFLNADESNDLIKAFVFERHKNTGTFAYGIIKGFGIKNGAMASTVAHDAHNLLVLGTNDADMSVAANTLIESGGGMIIVSGGQILAHVPLPIAGLMNPSSSEKMSILVDQLEKSWEQIGCTMPSPFMTMALIPLACLPELRLTNRGLVDCRTFEFTNLFIK
ncbi:adenine deaminase [Fusobacterium sp. PH5-44]|uniref:adenine deaminase n=1 Tax=unclassified Fusobacterium TaxID=2648384 RepID=UPI003D227D27